VVAGCLETRDTFLAWSTKMEWHDTVGIDQFIWILPIGLFFFLLRSIDSVILIWYFSNDTKHILLQLQPSCPSMDTYRVTIFIHVAFICSIESIEYL
jgi:hypothetical protein